MIELIKRIPCIGIAMALLSGIIFATASFLVESILDIDPIIVVTCRSGTTAVAYGLVALFTGTSLRGVKGERFNLFLRALFGLLCFCAGTTSFQYTSLSNNQTIIFSAPVFVSIFAHFFLRERCTCFHVSVIIVTIAGVVLITRPAPIFGEPPGGDMFTAEENVIGSCLALLASFLFAMIYVLIRKIKQTPVFAIIFWFGLFSVVIGILYLVVMQFVIGIDVRWPYSAHHFGMLALVGVMGVCGELFLTASLKFEEAGLVSLVRTFDIVMAFIYQTSFIPEQKVQLTSIIGAVIVCLSVVISCLKKLYDSKPNLRIFTMFGLGGSKKTNALDTIK